MSPTPTPAGTSSDARAVVRALDALTTQARRIADALSTPVVRTEATADDGPTTHTEAYTAWTGHQPAPHPYAEASEQAPPDDEDEEQALRWARRESFLLLLARAERGVLSPAEGRMMRQHVEHEMREADTARQHERAAWDATAHVLELKAELEQAQAAIERVQLACHDLPHEHARRILAALDGTEQTTTEG